MKYYDLHIAEYQGKTAHLTLAEHGAYFLMLSNFYASERPLPRERKVLYRLLRAESRAERTAVESVIRQFWLENEDGLTNKRAAEIVREYREWVEKQRANGKRRLSDGSAKPKPSLSDGIAKPGDSIRYDIDTTQHTHNTPSAPLRVARAGARERVGSFQKPVWIPPKTADELEREEAERVARESDPKKIPIQALGGGHADG